MEFLGRSHVRLIGRYYLHEEIGVGGMAAVHLGWMIDGSRVVAIKRIRGDLVKDPDVIAMFCDEARVARQIVHRNVVRTLDVVQTDDQPFLVMEYVRGASLSQLVRCAWAREESVPPAIAAGIAVGMLRGLHATHEARDEQGEALSVIHRDVSPQNVMVDTNGTSRVVDFGIAKATGATRVAQMGELRGRIHYVAPEQLSYGGAVTRRTDIYAASVVLWETLCGRKLFGDDLRASTSPSASAMGGGRACVDALLRRYSPIPAPSTLVAGIPRALDEVILRGLDPVPTNRFATAQEMANALEACGLVASEDEIGAWVRSLEDPEFEARERLVEEVERGSGTIRTAHAEAPAWRKSGSGPRRRGMLR